ncbi:hypothetical protein AB8P51_05595 [Muriicola sp. SD30]|uniref:DUF6973 domain-containing protein n=1 Tax=Muriicola sp. SD30 TaxID=3240936 RepID=UPI00350E98D6
MKELWGVIKRAKPGQLAELIVLCLKNICFVFPTYKATKSTIAFANAHFGLSHRRNTPANAFRHALWNWLIARACYGITMDKEKVLLWTKKITDMHEKILPGNAVSNAMDLHNNAVGRHFFKTEPVSDVDLGVTFFLALTERSEKVNTLEEIMQTPLSQLVHLLDPKS